MRKLPAILLLVFLLGSLSADVSVEQHIYGILSGVALLDQKVAVNDPLIADFGEGPDNEFSFGEIEDIKATCEKIEGPANLVAYKVEPGKCIVRWDDNLTSNPTAGEIGKHYVQVRVKNENEDFFDYYFTITVYPLKTNLYKKWNLISIPLVPDNTSINFVLDDEVSKNAEAIWEYVYDENQGANVWKYNIPNSNGTAWTSDSSRIQNIIPGYGYWIKMANESALYQSGEEFYTDGNETWLPKVNLTKSWNLIGYYGTEENTAHCSLYPISNNRWSALYGYDAEKGKFITMSHGDTMRPGKGYWLEIDSEDSYAPSEECPV